jgi:two-component system, cell cycle response regulator DivK
MDKMDFSDSTVLIAEDNTANFSLFQLSLAKTGVKVLHAADGKVAVDICLSHPEIGMVFMDGMMPSLNGYEATREIRKFRPGLPIVLITAFVSSKSIQEAIANGCNDYIAKPISPETLRAVLNKWLLR